MATLKHAELEFDGRQAVYEADFVSIDFETPVLLIGVANFEEAQELLSTLERSAARKRKDAPAAKPEPASGNGEEPPKHRDPPKCAAPDCIFDADGGDLCRDHAGATAEQKAEWRKGPKTEGGRRARKLAEQLDGGAPGPRAGAA